MNRWKDRGLAADWLKVGKALFIGLMARVAVSPSMRGICMSIRIKS